ncbi:MAG: Stp1/IreP family PP2C-type Ser/Thr phosphatase [Desulfatibacillaceae bacterium]
MRACGATHTGMVRKNNEDFFLVNPERNVYIVADGMGGHRAGEVASRLAAESVNGYFSERLLATIRIDDQRIESAMKASLVEAHRLVLEMGSENQEQRGMGCTMVTAVIVDDALHLCHVGDARAYVCNADGIHAATTDHSVVMAMVNAGRMTLEEARHSPFKNEITMAVGGGAPLLPDYTLHELCDGDRIVLCSDGLWDMLEDARIHQIAMAAGTAGEACEELIAEANDAGGRDNVTVVVVFHESGARESGPF